MGLFSSRKKKWKPPNGPLDREHFNSLGDFEVWRAILDLRERTGEIEGELEVSFYLNGGLVKAFTL